MPKLFQSSDSDKIYQKHLKKIKKYWPQALNWLHEPNVLKMTKYCPIYWHTNTSGLPLIHTYTKAHTEITLNKNNLFTSTNHKLASGIGISDISQQLA